MPTPGEHTCGEHPFLTFPARRLRSATLRPRVRNAMLQNDFLEINVKGGNDSNLREMNGYLTG